MDSKVKEAYEYISSHTSKRPKIALILGSGLGFLADNVEDGESISYRDIPNFPYSTAPGHEGKFVLGSYLAGSCCLNGRFHIMRMGSY